MSHPTILSLALVLLLCGAACKRNSDEPAGGASATISSAANGSARSAADKTSRRARGKCPNWVPGAKTELIDEEGGVVLVITADGEPAVSAIRDKARYLAAGKSKGGDATGQCPVIRHARIEASDVSGGVRVTLRPNEQLDLAQLRAQVRARLAQSAQ